MAEAQPHTDARLLGGQLLAAISNNMVHILADYTGRGATRARTAMNGDWVFITLEDALSRGERKLAEIGRSDFVLESRRAFQSAMRDDIVAMVETLTGRRVIAFLSTNHIDPDVGLEALLLEPDDAARCDRGASSAAST